VYVYENEKKKIFTEEGQVDFLKVRDQVFELLSLAGAFRMNNAWKSLSCYDIFAAMSYVDRLVELGEIQEITNKNTFGQDRVFVKA
jgi:hypothetical protein